MENKEEELSKRTGIIKYEDLLIVPYNHWKNDLDWIFFIMGKGKDDLPVLLPGYAIKLDEALNEAVKTYRQIMKEQN